MKQGDGPFVCEHKRTVPVCLCIKSVPGRGGGAARAPLANAKQAPLFIFTDTSFKCYNEFVEIH